MTQSAAALARRREVAAAVGSVSDEVATAVTDDFIARHPDWLERFGADAVRHHGEADARSHLGFLAGAVQASSPSAFAEYAAWAAALLDARGIAPECLREHLVQVERVLAVRLPEHAGLLAPYFAAADATLSRPATAVARVDDPSTVAGMFLQALLTGRRHAALDVAEQALAAGMPLLDLYADVIQASLYEIGRRWATGDVSVADEHVATAISQYVLSSIYGDRGTDATRGGAVVTGVRGEMHQLGSHMVADALEADGWSVRFLGTDLPDRDVLAAASDVGASLVAVSTTMLFNLGAAEELIRALRGLEPVPRILVGGRAFRSSGEAWREMGADGASFDVRAAIQLARQWSAPTLPG